MSKLGDFLRDASDEEKEKVMERVQQMVEYEQELMRLRARHDGDVKVVRAAEACARKHQERTDALLSEVTTANARERKAFAAGFYSLGADEEQKWQEYRCQDDSDWKVVSEEQDCL